MPGWCFWHILFVSSYATRRIHQLGNATGFKSVDRSVWRQWSVHENISAIVEKMEAARLLRALCAARANAAFVEQKWPASSRKFATPVRSSPNWTVKQRRRLYSKQPSSTSVSLPLELPDAKLRDSALIDHCLSPEAPSTTNVSFFQFRCSWA